jgi:hypothetical protein
MFLPTDQVSGIYLGLKEDLLFSLEGSIERMKMVEGV